MHSYKCFNSNYMEFVGCETCDKLIWTSGDVCRNINTIIKQGIPISNMNITSTSAAFGFCCSPHKYTCYILSENLVSQILQAYSSINEGGLFSYINKVK